MGMHPINVSSFETCVARQATPKSNSCLKRGRTNHLSNWPPTAKRLICKCPLYLLWGLPQAQPTCLSASRHLLCVPSPQCASHHLLLLRHLWHVPSAEGHTADDATRCVASRDSPC